MWTSCFIFAILAWEELLNCSRLVAFRREVPGFTPECGILRKDER